MSSILFVDDEPMLRRAFTRMFQHLGLTVVTAANGQEALTALDQDAFDLVLCDVRMPLLDGPSALVEARRRNLRLPPWVFLTGYADLPDAELRAMGAETVLSKPCTLQTIRALLQHYGLLPEE